MVHLPATEFTYYKYDSSAIPFAVYTNRKLFIDWLLKQDIIGYCKSKDCEIRPRPGEFAVMFEEDNWQGWCHVPVEVFTTFLNIRRRKN